MKRIALIAICITLAGCVPPGAETKKLPLSPSQIETIKSVASYNLNDPATAQFRNIRHIEAVRRDGTTTAFVCGEINGKNHFGAYVGFYTFKGSFKGDKFLLQGIGNHKDNWVYQAICPN